MARGAPPRAPGRRWHRSVASSRNMLRGNWSSTMTSASAPSSLASHDDNSPAAACRHRSRKRRRTSASNASSRLYQRSWPASRQNAKNAGRRDVSFSHRQDARTRLQAAAFFLVAQFAAQDLADIGLGQVGPELDLLGHLVGGELRAAVLDDFLGGEVRVLLDDEGLRPPRRTWRPARRSRRIPARPDGSRSLPRSRSG